MQEIPSAWSFKNFRYYTFTGILLFFASQTQSLIIGWQVYEIKHAPFYLGLIGLTEALPALSLALVSGFIVDRSNPLTIYKNIVRLVLLISIMLLVVSLPALALTGDQKLPFLYLAAFLGGVARGFRMPAQTAFVPQLVPRESLHISSAWTTTSFSVASAAGPAIGGFLYAFRGALLPYGINVVLLFLAIFLAANIKLEYKKNVLAPRGVSWADLTAGLRYVFSHQLLLGALALDMFAVLFGGVVALLPIFAGEILKVGSSGLGILSASDSVGALLGGILLIRFPLRRNSGKVLLGAVTGFGLCMIGFGLSKIFWLSVLLLACGGVFDSISVVVRSAIVQLAAPAEMRGRIGAVNSIFIGVSNQLGEFESGMTAAMFGIIPSVVAGGLVTLLVVGITAIKAPKLRDMHISDL